MRNKVSELEIFLHDSSTLFDIICINEHCLNKDEADLLTIQNYRLATYFAREPRNNSQRSFGGVLIMSKDGLSFTPLTEINNFATEKDCELSSIKIHKFNLIIISVYRTPDSNFKAFLSILNEVFTTIKVLNNDIIVCGDFNVHFNSKEITNLQFKDFIDSFGLKPVVNEPTRKQNCLDNFLINIEVPLVAYSVETSLSDHKGIILKMMCKDPVQKTPKFITGL